MKLKILIVDDISDHRKWISASLVESIFSGALAERLKVAEAIFEIHKYSIVGEAIEVLKKGFRPDLSIVDLDFQNLQQKSITTKQLDPNLEKSPIRGFDLLNALKQYAPQSVNVIYTGQAANEQDISEQLAKSKLEFGKDWMLKSDKGYGGTQLSSHMPYLLKRASWNKVQLLADNKKSAIRTLISDFKDATLLTNYCVEFTDGSIVSLDKLLIGWASSLNCNGKVKIVYDDLDQCIKELFKDSDVYGTKLRGIWNWESMKQALRDYRSQGSAYYSDKENIDRRAAEVVLELCKQILRSPKNFHCHVNFVSEGYNCKHDIHSLGNEEFKRHFYNALTCRRILLGLTKIRDNRKTQVVPKDVIDIVCSIVGRDYKSVATVRQFINTLLGLSAKVVGTTQIIDYQNSNILEEEFLWLQQYIPIIEDRIKSNAWTSFYDT